MTFYKNTSNEFDSSKNMAARAMASFPYVPMKETLNIFSSKSVVRIEIDLAEMVIR